MQRGSGQRHQDRHVVHAERPGAGRVRGVRGRIDRARVDRAIRGARAVVTGREDEAESKEPHGQPYLRAGPRAISDN